MRGMGQMLDGMRAPDAVVAALPKVVAASRGFAAAAYLPREEARRLRRAVCLLADYPRCGLVMAAWAKDLPVRYRRVVRDGLYARGVPDGIIASITGFTRRGVANRRSEVVRKSDVVRMTLEPKRSGRNRAN